MIEENYICSNPFTLITKKSSDWADILTIEFFYFFKNILLVAIFYYLALLKSYRVICELYI